MEKLSAVNYNEEENLREIAEKLKFSHLLNKLLRKSLWKIGRIKFSWVSISLPGTKRMLRNRSVALNKFLLSYSRS